MTQNQTIYIRRGWSIGTVLHRIGTYTISDSTKQIEIERAVCLDVDIPDISTVTWFGAHVLKDICAFSSAITTTVFSIPFDI
jgi:hypothetical protein